MKHLIIALSATVALATSASADTINSTNVSNLASSDNATVNIDNTGEATAFTTGASSATLYAADLLIDAQHSPTLVQAPGLTHPNILPPSVVYNAYIYSDVSGAPGSRLYTLTQLGPAGTKTLRAYSAPANSTLAAATTYWLVLQTRTTGNIGGWEATTSDSVSSPAGWTIAGGGYILGGSSFSNTPLFDVVVTETVETPEPGTLALAGLGSLGLFLFRRRA